MSPNWSLLSFLRFTLALLVTIAHLNENMVLPDFFVYFSMLGGFQAVLGFLLISGFSIGFSIQKDEQNFYKKRFLRIYPIYITCLLIVFFVKQPVLDGEMVYILFVNIFLLQNALTSTAFLGPSWSLSLEVWLYALAPYLKKLNYKTLLVLSVLSFICYVAYAFIRNIYHLNYFSETSYGINLLTLSFLWIAGFAYAIYEAKRKQLFKIIGIMLLGQVLVRYFILFVSKFRKGNLDSFVHEDVFDMFMNSLLLIYICIIFYYALKPQNYSVLTKKIFNFLGDISYPLYLIHMPVFIFLKEKQVNFWGWYIGVALVLATILYKGVDFYSQKRHKVSA